MAKRNPKGKPDNRFTYIVAATLIVGVGLILLLSLNSGGNQPPANVADGEIDVETGFVLGAADAPITIVEFGDYQCPFCARSAVETFPHIKEKYIDAGLVRYIAKDYPLASFPQSTHVAEYLNCAVNQDADKYWALRDLVFGRQQEWSGQRNFLDRIKGYAAEVGLDLDEMQSCYRGATMRSQIQQTRREGDAIGITGTPAVFVNGVQVGGFVPWEDFDEMLTELLASEGE